MTPAARVQAAIAILDLIIAAARCEGAPADRIIGEWFKARRFAGSGDRRVVRELVYAACRRCGPAPASGRAAMLRLAQADPTLPALFDGSTHAPAPLDAAEPVAEGGVAPTWLAARLAASGISGAAAQALLARAPLDVRVNALKAARDTVRLPVPGTDLPTPHGLRFPAGTPVDQWEAYRGGLIEIQDCGSQLACQAVEAQPGETIIDLCAGAGGKTLALAAAMANRGHLIACDTDRSRLSRLGPRARRAGAEVETRLLNPGREGESMGDLLGAADTLLVDAPCSGTGTWRRNPEARWRLSEAGLARLVGVQSRVLELGARLVRPGGRLVYVVCSLLDDEGADRLAAFLAGHPGWRVDPVPIRPGEPRGGGQRLAPHRDGCDGFFIARAVRAC